jgi:hypothetical protein
MGDGVDKLAELELDKGKSDDRGSRCSNRGSSDDNDSGVGGTSFRGSESESDGDGSDRKSGSDSEKNKGKSSSRVKDEENPADELESESGVNGNDFPSTKIYITGPHDMHDDCPEIDGWIEHFEEVKQRTYKKSVILTIRKSFRKKGKVLKWSDIRFSRNLQFFMGERKGTRTMTSI